MGIGHSATLVVALCTVLITPIVANASDIVTQQVNDSVETHTSVQYLQTLGTGLSGTISGILVNAGFGSGVHGISGGIIECTSDANCLAESGTVFFFYNSSGVVASTLVSSRQNVLLDATYTHTLGATTTGVVLNPSKYYAFFISYDNGFSDLVGGSAADTYANGKCSYYFSGSRSDCGTVHDVYFRLFQNVSSQSQGIISQSPSSQQILSSTSNVPFTFTYWVDTSQGVYSYVGYELTDLTMGSQIDTSSATSSIIASGQSTYVNYRDLVNGHIYTWQPYMASNAGLSRLYGAKVKFYAGLLQSTYVSQGYNFASSTFTPYLSFYDPTSSTTGTVGYPTPSFVATSSPWGDIMQHKFPFSYFYDIGVLIGELNTGTTTTGVISFVTPTVFGVTPTTSPFIIADFNHLPASAQTPINQVRNYIRWGLWLNWGLAMLFVIKAAI